MSNTISRRAFNTNVDASKKNEWSSFLGSLDLMLDDLVGSVNYLQSQVDSINSQITTINSTLTSLSDRITALGG